MENNAILSALSARKSVRVFTPDPVTPDERAAILNAAFQAPTAGNQQLYTILDITDPALKAQVSFPSCKWKYWLPAERPMRAVLPDVTGSWHRLLS